MKTKIISILALLLTVTQGAWAAYQPSGNFEYAAGHEGSISVSGWAWDQDNPNTPISVHVYVFKDKNGDLTPSPSNPNVEASISITADNYRSDIISVTGDNGNHGFAKTFEVATPGTYYVCAWGIDGTDGNIELGSGMDITILAPFTVSYNANGGSGAPSAQEKCYDITLTLSSTQPTRDGYTFAGWNTAADGNGTPYAAGATYSANADVTLYAQWTCNTTTSGIDWNPSTKSGTFLMPAYNVEVSTELWYKVNEEKTLDENIAAYGTKSDFFLNRTLTANVWNTFASPFAIAAGDMTKYFGAGAKVRQLESTSVDGTVLTLNFTDATEIVAGQPYLVKPAATVDFSADGKEFAGVSLTAASATPTEKTHVDFVPTLGKTWVEGNMNDILILNTSGTLVYPSAVGNMKGFRGYFLMHDAAAGARAFVINFGDGETTGIQPIRMENGTTPAEGTYDLSGRRIQGQPTQKGVYIQNGKKVIK